MNNTMVYDNRAYYRGGAVYIYIVNYNSYGYGNLDFQLKIRNTTAHRNRVDHGDGGAIHVYNYNRNGPSNFQIRIDTTMVYDNRADRGDGGAIYIRSYRTTNSWSSISQCHFINNTACQGSGAIYSSMDSWVLMCN